MRKDFSIFLSTLAIYCTACNTDTITVTYNNDKVDVSPEKFDDVEINVKDCNVKIKNNVKDKELTFVLKGECKNGSFALSAEKEAAIELDGLNLTSNEGAALLIKNKRKVTCQANEGTDNTLTITACEDTANYKASAIHAKDKLTFCGKGTLNVIATGKGCKGINAKDDITVEDLALNVTTSGMYLSEDTSHMDFPGGPMGPDFDPDNMPEDMKKHMEEMKKQFENGGHPMMGPGGPMGGPGQGGTPMGRPEGQGGPMGEQGGPMGGQGGPDMMGQGGMPPMGDGPMGMPPGPGKRRYIGKAKAIRSKGQIIINSGNVTVNTSTPGAEGIEGKNGVVINDGTVYVKASDDAINANDKIFFNGGDVTAISTGNDAVDSNLAGDFPPFMNQNDQMGGDGEKKKEQKSAIIINGGTVRAWSQVGPPEEGLDCDFSPIEITGGNVLSIGAGMGEMPSVPTAETATQPTALVIGLNIQKDKVIEIYETDNNGKATGSAIASYKPSFDFNGSSSIITCPAFKVGNKYIIKSDSWSRTIDIKEKFTVCRL